MIPCQLFDLVIVDCNAWELSLPGSQRRQFIAAASPVFRGLVGKLAAEPAGTVERARRGSWRLADLAAGGIRVPQDVEERSMCTSSIGSRGGIIAGRLREVVVGFIVVIRHIWEGGELWRIRVSFMELAHHSRCVDKSSAG